MSRHSCALGPDLNTSHRPYIYLGCMQGIGLLIDPVSLVRFSTTHLYVGPCGLYITPLIDTESFFAMNVFLPFHVTVGHGDMSEQSLSSRVLRIPSRVLELVGGSTPYACMSSLITWLSWGICLVHEVYRSHINLTLYTGYLKHITPSYVN